MITPAPIGEGGVEPDREARRVVGLEVTPGSMRPGYGMGTTRSRGLVLDGPARRASTALATISVSSHAGVRVKVHPFYFAFVCRID